MYDLDDIEKDDDQKDELPEFMRPDEGEPEAEAGEIADAAIPDYDDEDDNQGNR